MVFELSGDGSVRAAGRWVGLWVSKFESWASRFCLVPYSDIYFESVIVLSSPHSLLTLFTPFTAALWPTAAVEIYTSGAVEAVNGTDIRLKCTFSSFAPVGDALTVTWNFRPRDGGPEQFVSRSLSLISGGPLVREALNQCISLHPSCIFLSSRHRGKLGNNSWDRD